MALGIYAGDSASGVVLLPSPTQVTPTREIIWSANTGRAQSGENKAQMIGDVVAEKTTYAIKWGMLSDDPQSNDYIGDVTSRLKAGFFYFALAPDIATARSQAKKFYRSEIAYDVIVVGSDVFYKDVTVSVIEQ